MKIHHLGYLVKDIGKAWKMFSALGFSECAAPLDGITRDDYREIDIMFIERDGYCLELIAPTSRESKMYPLLKKQRNTAYHVCYESFDIATDLEELSQKGWSVIDPLAPAPALEGHDVCFLLNPDIGMIELIDAKGEPVC